MKKQPTSKHGSSHRDQIKMLPTDWYIYSSYMYHILHPTPSGLRSFLAWFPLDQHRPTMARHTTSSSGSPLLLPAEIAKFAQESPPIPRDPRDPRLARSERPDPTRSLLPSQRSPGRPCHPCPPYGPKVPVLTQEFTKP